ncbi:MAG: HPr family phosphocarrier protein [Desulfovibrio sp.]|jgi:phosphocarrier protein|nr:HPr family phosphocarrier protein [Desulfovibrio sp.]
MNEFILEKEVIVRDEIGLHARPAARLAQAAQEFAAQVWLQYGSMRVDAKSVLDILSLSAARGATLTIGAEGADAERALTALEEIFNSFTRGE